MKTIFFLIVFFILNGCVDQPEPKFNDGELVVSVLSNDTGMVVQKYYIDSWVYKVRFYHRQSYTNTHLLRPDDAIYTNQFSLPMMKEFELKKVKK